MQPGGIYDFGFTQAMAFSTESDQNGATKYVKGLCCIADKGQVDTFIERFYGIGERG